MILRFDAAHTRRSVLVHAILAVLFAASAAQADTHYVVSTGDAGAGSLRQAVLDANADAHTPVVVDASALLDATITLSTGEISILQPMHVVGPGPDRLTISGNDASRIFYINLPSPDDVTISGLHLTAGGGLGAGGALSSACSNLSLIDSVIDHSTVSHGALPHGGGVFAQTCGTATQLVFSQVTIADNNGPFGGGFEVSSKSRATWK